ncbi:MAG: NADH-quinone oxidoreductase subunit L [Dehalococcoidia bacterium]|nr:NADH-quinone oxidoreductase subunit L [Dehalococcoidia bacterium]
MGAEQAYLLAAVPAGMFLVLALFGRYMPRGGDFLGVLAIGTSFVLFFFVLVDFLDFYNFEEHHVAITKTIEWARIGPPGGGWDLRFGTYVDPMTIVMFGVITSVALMVNIFSIGYMKNEPRYWWFFAVLQLFAASMLMLVMADNLLLLLISWELVGVCSFLLIGFYWEKRSATEAAKKAFITTRTGDVGLMIGIILLYREAGTFNIQEIIHMAEAGEIGGTSLFVTMAFLFLGAMGKSAQVPFHVWLPDAMEGPTPVSALIHAATMVVAGVYLTARMLPVYAEADGMLLIITLVGLTTALVTGFIAITQTDIKKVLAYSTVGQLGFMFVALGTGHPTAAMFHLMTHAFFKALLFLGSGSVIHATHHHQEMDDLGGLWKKMPITGTTFLIGCVALSGLAPLAGFWSKDEIFAETLDKWGWTVIPLGIAAIFTAFYSTRLFIRTFMGQPRNKHVYEHTHESNALMTGPLLFLAALALVSGFFVFDGVAEAIGFPGGIGAFVFSHEPHHFGLGDIDWPLAAASTGMSIVGIFFGAWLYWGNRLAKSTRIAEAQPGVYQLLKNKFYFDELYQWFIDKAVLGFSFLTSWFDRYVVNDTGVDGSAQLTGYTGSVLKYIQTGRLPNYAMGIALGVLTLALAGLAVRG